MASETDVRIARAVALKAAVELVNGNVILLADLEAKATELVTFLLDINPARHETSDPGPTPPVESPPAEWPEDKPDYGNNDPPAFVPPPQGPVGQANPICLCGAEKPWNPQHQGWFCPNQKKSRDPAVQAQQKLEHPPSWP